VSEVTVAALFVDKKGCYAGLPGVELWDEKRDARTYAGPHPVVAHPPCTRWCQLIYLNEARWGFKRGEDEGCFESALRSVRTFGGVLEHPAYTLAWSTFGLPVPRKHGWQQGLFDDGWVCHVDQGMYDHPAKKAIWLYAYGIKPPTLRWGESVGTALVSHCKNHVRADEDRRRLGKREASATPPAFRDALLAIARTARKDQDRV